MDWLVSVLGSLGRSVAACLPAQTVVLHGRVLRTVLLAEGGFSFVFRAEDASTGEVFALKRMTCLDDATVEEALHEIALYKQFDHPNLMRCIDSAVEPSTIGPNAKDVYMLLPFYRRGTVQQALDRAASQGTDAAFSEEDILSIFRDVCRGVHAMHHYRLPDGSADAPLAHRDIKPANVLLADEGHAVLMDFGSAAPARIQVTSRKHAMTLMDVAAQRCTMPYRPPELFDLPSDAELDERTDIWSLGCLLYAMAYGRSPFELTAQEASSGSVALKVISGRVNFPSHDRFSTEIRALILYMLVVDPARRPTIDDVRRRLGDTADAPKARKRGGMRRSSSGAAPAPAPADADDNAAVPVPEPEPPLA